MSGRELAEADWLRSRETQAVFAALEADGERARAVGGAVRNFFLGVPVHDIDIATTALPSDVTRLCVAAGLGVHETGLKHGTVTVVSNGKTFEVTTLRRDEETDGRHAQVAFSRDWDADARRRDFTINAIYCDRNGEIFDPLGGCEDVRARRVRFVGDARARIREDYLRILRYFRFIACYSKAPPEADAVDACICEQAGIDQLSGERIRSEMLRLLVADGAVGVIDVMAETGLLQRILGTTCDPARFRDLVGLEVGLGRQPDGVLRLAALGALTAPGAASSLSRRLKVSNNERARLTVAANGPEVFAEIDEAHVKSLLYRMGRQDFESGLLIAWASSGKGADDLRWRPLYEQACDWEIPTLPFKGADLLEIGLAPGPHVGEILNAFEDWWIGADFPDNAALLRQKFEAIAERFKKNETPR